MVHKQQQVVLRVDEVADGLQNDADKLFQAAAPSTDAPEGFVQLGQPLLLSPVNEPHVSCSSLLLQMRQIVYGAAGPGA